MSVCFLYSSLPILAMYDDQNHPQLANCGSGTGEPSDPTFGPHCCEWCDDLAAGRAIGN